MKKKFYELQFEIETTCLLDCVHCSSIQSRFLSGKNYTDEDVLKMLTLFAGETYVYFTGGEPLLYPRLLTICNNIVSKSKSTKIGIYTTGNLNDMNPINRQLAVCMGLSGISDCYFSIYYASEKEHDQWTNRNGSFTNTLISIENLKQAGISVKAHLVLTRGNILFLKQIINFCDEIGLEEVRILRLAPTGNAKKNWTDIGIPLDIQNATIRQIISQADDFNVRISVSGYPDIYPCRGFPVSKGCQAGTNLLYIDASGDIYPCACTKSKPLNFKICNIKEIDKLEKYLETMSDKTFYRACLNPSAY